MDDIQAQRGGSALLAVVALLIALAALVLSILAYNRSGRNIDQTVRDQLTTAQEDAQLAIAKTNAAVRLTVLRARIETNTAGNNVQNELNSIQSSLQTAYERAGNRAGTEWSQVRSDFQSIDSAVKSNSKDTLNLMQNLIDKLQATP